MRLFRLEINNTSALQAFQIMRYGVLVVINIFLAKVGLSKEQIGVYETVLFISGLFTFFWVSGLIQSMLPLVGSDLKEKSNALFNVFVVLVTFSIFVVVIGLIFEPFFRTFSTISNFPYFKLALLFAAVSAPGNLAEYIFLVRGASKKIVVYGLVVFFLQLLVVVAAIVLGFGTLGAVYGLLVLAAFKTLWVFYLVVRYSTLKISTPFILHFLSLGLPLTGKMLVGGSASYIDGLIITSRFDLASFVTFRYGARDLPLVTLMANGLSNSMLPEFSENNRLTQSLKLLKNRSKKLMHILFPVTIVSIILSKPLFPIIFNPEFAESASIFMVYLLTVSSRILFPQTIAIGLRKTKALLLISIVELSINVSLSLLLINYLGIVGVAWATVIAFLIEKLLIGGYIYFKNGIKPSSYIPLKPYMFYMFFTAIAFSFAILFM